MPDSGGVNNYGVPMSGTSTQRAAITNAVIGSIFYDTTDDLAYVMAESATWQAVSNGGTITGGATVDSIVGGDSSLGINGKAGSAGGAGGAVPVTGGAGNDTGAGGAASVTGGASGAGATGTGGAASLVGGASGATNGAGGVASVTGGAGAGTGAGGAVTIAGGASGSGATGNGGAVTKVGGASAVYRPSMFFHPDAFAFATADLEMPRGVDMAARQVMT